MLCLFSFIGDWKSSTETASLKIKDFQSLNAEDTLPLQYTCHIICLIIYARSKPMYFSLLTVGFSPCPRATKGKQRDARKNNSSFFTISNSNSVQIFLYLKLRTNDPSILLVDSHPSSWLNLDDQVLKTFFKLVISSQRIKYFKSH